MEFQIGDAVFHPIYGVGQVVAISDGQFLNNAGRTYYEITIGNSTVWVPVEAHATIGLRHVTTKRELARYRTLLKSRPLNLDSDHTKRRTVISSQLKNGSLQFVCQIVRDLTARGWSKRLTQVDVVALRKAREKLEQEWAAALGVTPNEASAEIDELLQQGKREFMA